MIRRALLALPFLFWCIFPTISKAADPAADPAKIVQDAIEYWRDTSSYIVAELKIHRPDWERTSSVKSWTKGRKLSLVRFVAPAKDAGNASLTIDNDVWNFSPKVNKVVKIPPSMMSQSWMGSDFSFDDLAKRDDIIDDYDHTLLGVEKRDGQEVYHIKSVPKENAPVVWGSEELWIGVNQIIYQHDFLDQNGKLVKSLQALQVQNMGGKLYATRVRMEKKEEQDEWTEFQASEIRFGVQLPDEIFTVANLRNPRESS